MDISETTAPRTDQQNYDDYLGGITRTVTISAVTKGSNEQPVNVELAEYPGRPFKPNLSMRRVLLLAWGKDSSAYIGRKLTLFGNPEVVYGGKAVGGIEIAAMSHIDGPKTMLLTQTRGRKRSFTVKPLVTDAPPVAPLPTEAVADWVASFKDAPDITALAGLWKEAVAQNVATHPEILAAKDARKAELT